MLNYKQLASFLQGLKPDPEAHFFYDLFADALVWSDEIPHPDSEGMDQFHASGLRGVWRYRTLLILGQAEDRYRAVWEEAAKCFPAWPGFDPNRQDPSLAEPFKQMRERAMRKWEEEEAKAEAALAKKQQASV